MVPVRLYQVSYSTCLTRTGRPILRKRTKSYSEGAMSFFDGFHMERIRFSTAGYSYISFEPFHSVIGVRSILEENSTWTIPPSTIDCQ